MEKLNKKLTAGVKQLKKEYTDLVEIISHKKLDIEKIQNNDKLIEYLVLDCETIEIVKNEIESRNWSNYKEIILQMADSGNKYLLLHGFPGDIPKGCILLENKSFVILDEFIKKDNNIDIAKISLWYELITEEYCNFNDDYWY